MQCTISSRYHKLTCIMAMTTVDLELHEYMMDFHPYRGGTNPHHTNGSDSQTLNYMKMKTLSLQPQQGPRFDSLRAKITNWLHNVITVKDAVILIAPGHQKGDMGDANFVCPLVDQFIADKKKSGWTLSRTPLERTEQVQKSTDGGIRSKDKHMRTIRMVRPEDLKDKTTVYIIDDVWTSGATLQACAEVVMRDWPEACEGKPLPDDLHIYLLAVGKTV